LLDKNPCLLIKSPKTIEPKKEFLTLEELKLLVQTDCRFPLFKRAFIFSCLTGLRWSDVYKLQWSEIQENQGKCSITFRQKKTKELNYLPLSEQAIIYLGERGSDTDKVFNLPVYSARLSKELQAWCRVAGVNKKITFHSSRHTFAVLQLSLGTPIFTVQKLLGHTDISSTMRYANIVDAAKEKAMNIIGDIFNVKNKKLTKNK
jgi:integrase